MSAQDYDICASHFDNRGQSPKNLPADDVGNMHSLEAHPGVHPRAAIVLAHRIPIPPKQVFRIRPAHLLFHPPAQKSREK